MFYTYCKSQSSQKQVVYIFKSLKINENLCLPKSHKSTFILLKEVKRFTIYNHQPQTLFSYFTFVGSSEAAKEAF